MKMHFFFKALFTVSVFGITQQAGASQFQTNSQTGSGIGRAYAGEAVIGDNASVMARNPAAITLFTKMALSLGVTSTTANMEVLTTNEVKNESSTTFNPNLYLIVPMTENFSIGIHAQSDMAPKTDFTSTLDALNEPHIYVTNNTIINGGLITSYRINNKFSLGAGIDFANSNGKLYKIQENIAPEKFDYSGFGYGFNGGIMFQYNIHNRFALSYHYSPKIKVSVNVDKTPEQIPIPIPDILEFSGYDKIPATLFAIHYSLQWNRWSDIKSKYLGDEWEDQYAGAIGSTYFLNSVWELHTGYRYEWTKPLNLSALGSSNGKRHWLAAGLTYKMNKIRIDFGIAYLLGQKTNFVSPTNTPTNGTQLKSMKSNGILGGIQANYSF